MIHGAIQAKKDMFIKLMIDGGYLTVPGMIQSYKAAYPNCKKDETARVGGYRLLQDKNIVEAIDRGVKEKEEALKRARQKEIDRIAREQVVTEIQVDAVLSSIVTGSRKKKRSVVVYDRVDKAFKKHVLDEEPDEAAIVAAANLLYKRKGSFAPTQLQHEAGDSFIEMMKALSEKNRSKQEGGHV
jgi:phage terminase small subunit